MSVNSGANHNHSQDIGIAYAVTNSKNITHILMGTTHMIDPKSLQNLSLQRILRCSELFTEAGTHIAFSSYDGCFPGVVKYDIPYPHSVDALITFMAGWKKIPIKSLDYEVPAMQDLVTMPTRKRRIFGADAVEKERSAYIQIVHQCEMEALKLSAQTYQQGNLDAIAKQRKIIIDTNKDCMYGTSCKIREAKWSEILIPKLLEADKPIGIAVGFLHVHGQDSLSERFAQAGLKVELITPKPRSHL